MEVEVLAKGRPQEEMLVGETRAAMMAGARDNTRAGGARWRPRPQPGRRPTVESKDEGAMVKMDGAD